MTASVYWYFVRYPSRLCAPFTDSAAASPSGVSAGSRTPDLRASSSIVAGRRQPSRCTCSSALGQRRSASRESCGGPRRAVTTTRKTAPASPTGSAGSRSEEHTSELQSLAYLVCRLLLEKKKNINIQQSQYCTTLNAIDGR